MYYLNFCMWALLNLFLINYQLITFAIRQYHNSVQSIRESILELFLSDSFGRDT